MQAAAPDSHRFEPAPIDPRFGAAANDTEGGEFPKRGQRQVEAHRLLEQQSESPAVLGDQGDSGLQCRARIAQ